MLNKNLALVSNTATDLYKNNKDKLIEAAKEELKDFGKTKASAIANNLINNASSFEDAKKILAQEAKSAKNDASDRLSDRLAKIKSSAETQARASYNRHKGNQETLEDMAFGDYDNTTGDGVRRRKKGRQKKNVRYASIL